MSRRRSNSKKQPQKRSYESGGFRTKSPTTPKKPKKIPLREKLKDIALPKKEPTETSIPDTIKHEGYTYKNGNYSSTDLELVTREAKKYTDRGIDVHIKEIGGRLYLYYRKVPKDLPVKINPKHPGSKVSDDDMERDESEPTRRNWIDNKIPPYWLKGTSRAAYIKSSSPNAPLYTEEDFTFDPATGKISSLYGWRTLNDFPKISEVSPEALKDWIKGSLTTAGAVRRTRNRKEDTDIEDEDEEPEDEDILLDEDEEEIEDVDEDDDTPSDRMKSSTTKLSGERDIGSSVKSALKSTGKLLKTTGKKGAKALSDYSEWVEKKNLEYDEREEDEELDDLLKSLEKGTSKKKKGTSPLRRSRSLYGGDDYEDPYERVKEIDEAKRRMIGGFGLFGDGAPQSREEIAKSRQDYRSRSRNILMGGGYYPVGKAPSPQQIQQESQEYRSGIIFGHQNLLGPPPTPRQGSQISKINSEINRRKQAQADQQQMQDARSLIYGGGFGGMVQQAPPSPSRKKPQTKPRKKPTQKTKTPPKPPTPALSPQEERIRFLGTRRL